MLLSGCRKDKFDGWIKFVLHKILEVIQTNLVSLLPQEQGH